MADSNATPLPRCKTCKGDTFVEVDPVDIDLAPAFESCPDCCGSGIDNGCPPEDDGMPTEDGLRRIIAALDSDVLRPLQGYIAAHKSADRPVTEYKLIPASFFNLLHAEQDCHKLVFQLENARRLMMREE